MKKEQPKLLDIEIKRNESFVNGEKKEDTINININKQRGEYGWSAHLNFLSFSYEQKQQVLREIIDTLQAELDKDN